MSFTSLNFAVFLPLVFSIYYIFPKKYRWAVILISNYVFYSFAGIQYVLVLLYVTVLSYLCTVFFEKIRKNRGLALAGFVIFMLLPLVYFKYTGFLVSNINIIRRALGASGNLTTMEIALPLGISFYTFSALGYVIDVGMGKCEAIRNPLHLAAGISFFPCLISGPIERQKDLVPRIVEGKEFDYELATYGLKQIMWGLFEKKAIADNLAGYVDTVFSDVHSYNGSALLLGSLFFTMQIYCDFAGYSDIAIGIGKLFGIELTRNFHSPYFSKSLHEFWGRWHISLSSWFRDYVYIPLGGNRKGSFKKNVNVMITMLTSGLWHGASWTFIAWGGLHGLVQVIENMTGIELKNNDSRIVRIIRTVLVFCIVSVLWIFFRAATFSDAWYLISHMFSGITNISGYIMEMTKAGILKEVLIKFVFLFAVLFAYDYYSLKNDVIKAVSSRPLLVRWCVYCVFIMLVLQFSDKGGAKQFVYAGF